MRKGRLITKMAVESEVELDPSPAVIPRLPDTQHARVSRSSLDQDLVKIVSEQVSDSLQVVQSIIPHIWFI